MFRKAAALFLALALRAGTAPEAKPEMVVQLGHTSQVHTVAFTLDGKHALTGGGNAIILWDLATGAELRTFGTHGSTLSATALSRDGKLLACGNLMGALWLVDLERGVELRTLAGHKEGIGAIAFSADGRTLATAGTDNSLCTWDVATGERGQVLQDENMMMAVAFSPDGRWLAGAGIRRNIRLWSWPECVEQKSLQGHEGCINSLAFSPDSTRLASGGGDGTVRLWDMATLTPGPVLGESKSDVNGVAFSADGRFVGAASGRFTEEDYAVRMWDVASGREVRKFTGHRAGVQCLAFSPDGTRLLTGHRNVIRVWDTAQAKEVMTLAGHASAVRAAYFSPDGRLVATAQNDSTGRIWDLAQGLELRVLRGHDNAISTLAFSPDSLGIVTAGFDKRALLWDVATGKLRETFKGHADHITAVAFGPDGRRLYTSSYDQTLRKWKATGGSDRVFKPELGPTLGVAVSPDGRCVATFSREKFVSIRDADSGTEIRKLAVGAEPDCVVFSPDGTQVVAGCQDHLAYQWNLATGILLRTFRHANTVSAAAFSADGSRLALGGWSGDVAIFDARTGQAVAEGTRQTGEVTSLSYSPDGRRLVSGGWDGAAHLREASGRELVRLYSLDRGWVAITPEGYFDGSPEGLKAIQWTVGAQSFPLEAFSEGYYAPALLPRLLGGERIASGDVSSGFRMPPLVRILSPSEGATPDSGEVDVRVEAQDQGGGVDEIRLFLNGKAVQMDTRGVKVAGRAGRTEVFHVALVDGENRLRAVALSSSRIESNPSEITVRFQGQERQAVLHVLAVGIDHYKNDAMNLNFARADAGAIAGFFTAARPGLFRNVEATPLYDAEASKAAILARLDSFRTLPPQDIAVIYLAGHGEVLDNTWYFLPYEVVYPEREEEVKAKGLSSTELQGAIRNIGAQKVLVLLDSCKSGQAMLAFAGRGVEDRKALAMLARATGVHIVAASTKDQFATEVKDLGHGVFTYTLLQGLQGAAGSGKVTVRGLLAYIESQLPEVSQKYKAQAQYPVVDSRGMDFPIAAGN